MPLGETMGIRRAAFLACVIAVAAASTLDPFCDTARAQSEPIEVRNLAVNDPSLIYHLAVRRGDRWMMYPAPAEGSEPYQLQLPNAWAQLEFRWALPPYPSRRRQVIFARTRYSPKQDISLYRNLRDDTDEEDGVVLGKHHDYYAKYHTAGRQSDSLGRSILSWHNPFHSQNILSYELVRHVLAVDAEAATERLILIQPYRDAVSWVPIKTQARPTEHPLTLTLAFRVPGGDEPVTQVFRFQLVTKP